MSSLNASPFPFFVSLRQREADALSGLEGEQNSIMGKLDEGLDDFFSKKVVRLSFK